MFHTLQTGPEGRTSAASLIGFQAARSPVLAHVFKLNWFGVHRASFFAISQGQKVGLVPSLPGYQHNLSTQMV